MEPEKEIPILDKEQNKLFLSLAKKFSQNKTERYLENSGSPWSVDHDTLVYIDDIGVDTASPGRGSEAVLDMHLTESEIIRLNTNGYLIKGENIFAFSRYLMESFIKATLLLQIADESHNRIKGAVESLVNGILKSKDDTQDVHLEVEDVEPELIKSDF